MGGRTDGGSKAAADADHQGNEEGEGVVAHLLGGLAHNGEKHSTCSGVGDKLGDEGADKTDGSHNHNRIGAADIEDAVSQLLGKARLLDGEAKDGTAGKDHENLPVDGFHSLIHVAATTDEHGGGGKEGTL